jgi:hypothetical protein
MRVLSKRRAFWSAREKSYQVSPRSSKAPSSSCESVEWLPIMYVDCTSTKQARTLQRRTTSLLTSRYLPWQCIYLSSAPHSGLPLFSDTSVGSTQTIGCLPFTYVLVLLNWGSCKCLMERYFLAFEESRVGQIRDATDCPVTTKFQLQPTPGSFQYFLFTRDMVAG